MTTGINDTGSKFDTSFSSVVDTGGKFVTGVNGTGGKFATGVNDTGGKIATGIADKGKGKGVPTILLKFF